MEKLARQAEKDRLEKERLEARKRREVQRITDVRASHREYLLAYSFFSADLYIFVAFKPSDFIFLIIRRCILLLLLLLLLLYRKDEKKTAAAEKWILVR